MLGISLFGVTPGYSKRDFAVEREKLAPIIQGCGELYLLDQFSVSVPPGGALHVFGGRIVQGQAVSFIGQYRHAVELGGNRDGGHYGAGIWLVDEWLDGQDMISAIDRMVMLVRERMIDEAGRFVRTFDQVDWSDAQALLDDLDSYRVGSPQGRGDSGPEHRTRKLLLTGTPGDTCERCLIDIAESLGARWAILANRVIYVSFDAKIVSAIRQLNRIEISTFDRLKDEETERKPEPVQRRRWVKTESSETPSASRQRDNVREYHADVNIPLRRDDVSINLKGDNVISKRLISKNMHGFRWLLASAKAMDTSEAQSANYSTTSLTKIWRRVLFAGAVLGSMLLGFVVLSSDERWLIAVTSFFSPVDQPLTEMRRSKIPDARNTDPIIRHSEDSPSQDRGPMAANTKNTPMAGSENINRGAILNQHEGEVICLPGNIRSSVTITAYLRSDAASFLPKLQAVEGHVRQLLESGDKGGVLSNSDLETIGALIARERLFRTCLDDTH